MAKEIYKAVANLPEELITPQIAAAAIEEGKIELLDYLPKSYLTGEVVMSLIEKNSGSYSYYGFKLSSLPETIRTKEVCEFAVKKDDANIKAVPVELRSEGMLKNILCSTERNIKYLPLFPAKSWSTELALKGVYSIYSKTTQNYGPRGGYHGSTTRTDIKRVQIFLSYVPNIVKTKQFYDGLFELKMKSEDIGLITPDKYKRKAYYLQVAARDFSLVPKSFYDYDMFMVGLEHCNITLESPLSYSYYRTPTPEQQTAKNRHEQLLDAIFGVMDDAMADRVIEKRPNHFKLLPDKFQTPARLINAIEKGDRDNLNINFENHPQLFTVEVCKAYIKKNAYHLPTFPETIWNKEFVDYCMEHGTSFNWFEKMPKYLQTKELIAVALDKRGWCIEHARPELISYEQAMKLYRDSDSYRRYIPKHFIQDFVDETGLDEKFFGGEVSFDTLRDSRSANTYCRVGNTYIGMSSESSYSAVNIVTVTRRTPRSFRPEMVFRQVVKTFHVTWLEKLFADYDPSFTKPTTNKATKPYQTNGYYTVKKVASECGIDIYSNSFLGEVIHYTAIIDEELVEYGSLDKIKSEINEYSVQDCDFGTPVFDDKMQVAV